MLTERAVKDANEGKRMLFETPSSEGASSLAKRRMLPRRREGIVSGLRRDATIPPRVVRSDFIADP